MLHDYKRARELASNDENVHAMLMACVLRGDTFIVAALRAGFPELVEETQKRYDAPGGLLVGETDMSVEPGGMERREDGLYDATTGALLRSC